MYLLLKLRLKFAETISMHYSPYEYGNVVIFNLFLISYFRKPFLIRRSYQTSEVILIKMGPSVTEQIEGLSKFLLLGLNKA